jgi:hypothetical protein
MNDSAKVLTAMIAALVNHVYGDSMEEYASHMASLEESLHYSYQVIDQLLKLLTLNGLADADECRCALQFLANLKTMPRFDPSSGEPR